MLRDREVRIKIEMVEGPNIYGVIGIYKLGRGIIDLEIFFVE
jgi:hypothetical protein